MGRYHMDDHINFLCWEFIAHMKDKQRKKYLASLTDRLVLGQMGRRDFLRSAGKLGLGASALGLGLGNRPFGLFPLAQESASHQKKVPGHECPPLAQSGHHNCADEMSAFGGKADMTPT